MPLAGRLDDRVRLYLDGHEAPVVESYEIVKSIFSSPSTFSARLGWGGVVAELLRVLVPRTKFELKINDCPLFTGNLDDIDASGEVGATEITIYGRDSMAPLHDAFIQSEQDVSHLSYVGVVQLALDACIPGTYALVFDAAANRKLTTGIGVTQTADAPGDPQETKGGASAKQLKLKVGERYGEAVKRFLDRIGLFLWADAEGNFILSAPNSSQPAAYRILRRRGQTRNAVNVVSAHLKNHTSGRYSSAEIFGRTGSRKGGRTKFAGFAEDTEMTAWGFKRALALSDANVSNPKQSAFYAQRKLAEARRMNWSLVYTVSGHTAPSPLAGGAMAVYCPDTIISVEDGEFGIEEDLYVERVAYKRGPATTTELTLSRPHDMIFGKVSGED